MDIIGELLRANMLQQVGDDPNRVDRLRSAASALADTLSSGEPGRLPTALLSAADSTSDGKTPMIRMSREALLKRWETLGNAFPDEPVELYRAVLLDAAVRAFSTSGVATAAGWYTLRTALQLLQTGRWSPVLRQLLAEWDDAAGAAAERAWAIDSMRSRQMRTESAWPAAKESDDEGTEKAAAQAEGSATRQLVQSLISAGAGSYNTAFTTALRNNLGPLIELLREDMRVTAEEVVREYAERMDQIAQTLLTESRERLGEMQRYSRAVALRTELLWWRTAAYSSSRRLRYSELTPAQAVIAAALDVHHMANALAPASVEHVMFDTVSAAVEGTIRLVDLSNCAWSAELATGREPADGTFLCAVGLGVHTPLASRDAPLPAAEASVVLFRDLQAARLLARQGSP